MTRSRAGSSAFSRPALLLLMLSLALALAALALSMNILLGAGVATATFSAVWSRPVTAQLVSKLASTSHVQAILEGGAPAGLIDGKVTERGGTELTGLRPRPRGYGALWLQGFRPMSAERHGNWVGTAYVNVRAVRADPNSIYMAWIPERFIDATTTLRIVHWR